MTQNTVLSLMSHLTRADRTGRSYICAMKTHFSTIVIGAGQAGLAAGYYLKRSGEDFLIIDENPELGYSWKKRWDTLKLFTPRWADGLPGMRFTEAAGKFPGKDAMADYLQRYAAENALPVFLNVRVGRLLNWLSGYRIETREGIIFTCKNVIVATGNFSTPRIPELAKYLDNGIHQIHSSEYRNSRRLPSGPILVVGAGTSGLQIALDVAASGRKTYVAGTPPHKVPDFAVRYMARPVFWFMRNMLTIKTRPGRKVAHKMKVEGQAAPLINISLEQVTAAGVEHLPRLESVREGYPSFRMGDINKQEPECVTRVPLRVAGVIWCTGYDRDLSWIELDHVVDEQGYPLTYCGVSARHEGLYFMGMAFQYSLASVMINGVGRDARYIVRHIRDRRHW